MEFGPNSKTARPSEILRSQQAVIRQQDELIEVLKGALAAAGVNWAPTYAAWMSALARQERALVGILFASYPRSMPREAILGLLPSYDHARERQLQIVDILVHKVRKKLGKDTVVTERGEGFRLGESVYGELQALGVGMA
jgi:DNA-binding response OmpR family regulator